MKSCAPVNNSTAGHMFALGWLTAVAAAATYAFTVLPAHPGTDWRCGAVWHATRPSYSPLDIPLSGALTWECPLDVAGAADISAALEAMRIWDRWATPHAQFLLVTRHGVSVVAFQNAFTAGVAAGGNTYGVVLDMDAYTEYLDSKDADPAWVPDMHAPAGHALRE